MLTRDLPRAALRLPVPRGRTPTGDLPRASLRILGSRGRTPTRDLPRPARPSDGNAC